VIVLVALVTTPWWLARVGLYQYLALEVMIWMLFALGYNLMLGTTACRRSAMARSSVSGRMRSACCSSASGRVSGSTWPVRC